MVGVALLADDVDRPHVAQAVGDLLSLAVAHAESGGDLAAGKRLWQRGGQERGKVCRAVEAVLGRHANEDLVVDAPAAPSPTAAAVVAARFLDLDEEHIQQELRMSDEGWDAHELIKDVEQRTALGRTAAAELGVTRRGPAARSTSAPESDAPGARRNSAAR